MLLFFFFFCKGGKGEFEGGYCTSVTIISYNKKWNTAAILMKPLFLPWKCEDVDLGDQSPPPPGLVIFSSVWGHASMVRWRWDGNRLLNFTYAHKESVYMQGLRGRHVSNCYLGRFSLLGPCWVGSLAMSPTFQYSKFITAPSFSLKHKIEPWYE